MANHTVDCEECGEDLRGLTGGHAAGCSQNVSPGLRKAIDNTKADIKRAFEKPNTDQS